MKTLDKEETFEAIKQGVKEAFLEMMEAGNGFTGPIRTDQVMESIENGVSKAFVDMEIKEDLIHQLWHLVEEFKSTFFLNYFH